MRNQLFAFAQYLTPQTGLSRTAGWLAESPIKYIKNPLINWFIKTYKVDLTEAVIENPEQYKSFNDFFTRALKADARTISDDANSVACPADGMISELGTITEGKIVQAKKHQYTTLELLGGDNRLAQQFEGGQFITVYLSPKDYHRVHMPVTGKLQQMVHIPGDLFSVNQATADNIPRLFARNERVVCVFNTELGPVALVLVGAMIVASIETIWAGQITPQAKQIQRWNYADRQPLTLNKGEEMGRFKLGSTVIALFGKQAIEFTEKALPVSDVRMGETIATIVNGRAGVNETNSNSTTGDSSASVDDNANDNNG